MRELSTAELTQVAGGSHDPRHNRGPGIPLTGEPDVEGEIVVTGSGPDLDSDGDYDSFDRELGFWRDRGMMGNFETIHEPDDPLPNLFHEFFEDIFELFDGNPNNNSFTDGGNGSGNETPTPG
jgi:hypothetical protein